ncbi:OPT family oligopeptide transporter [Niveibacterium sp.]|uniref:OPT family oligopeptide transporter n=1 Tax=Niveibacterium sp. TaxID=2017444 RepID=UPI0035AF8AEC
MALIHLTDEETRTWTRAQKDEWWFKNVYRGDMAQLTIRSAITGFLLGGILSATMLYIGAKTGLGLGVGLTSVILSFAMFRALSNAGYGKDMTILENNCTQSIATAAGYMTTPLTASLVAYMLISDKIIPGWQIVVWQVIVAILGVLIAFPLKRHFINDQQMPFPEGRACGVVLDSLYTSDAAVGVFKARLLAIVAAGAGVYQMLISDGWMKLIQFKLLRMDKWAGMTEPWVFHERFDTYYYNLATAYHLWIPKILGMDIRQLGWRATLDASLIGVGGLMGIAVASSVLLGSFINFAVLAPIVIQLGDIVPRVAADGTPIPINRGEIVNQWSLWWGVAMMVTGSLVSLIARPEIFTSAWKSLTGRKKVANEGPDILSDIELPLWVSYVGVPVFSVLGAWVTHEFFGVPWLLSVVSLPLIFVLTIIGTNSMALTSWIPIGAMSKITQFSIGALDRSNPASNLLPAGMTAEISANAANLLSDIKPGYMLGAKPRQQAIGHIIGIFAGALACVPLFFLLFLPKNAEGVRSTATIVSDAFAFPAALQWKGVAEIIAKGVSALPTSAVIAMVVACLAAIAIEVAKIVTKGRFPLSAVSIGLGVVLPPDASLTMFVGALLFWYMHRCNADKPGTRAHSIWVDGLEPICAGLISGAALVGIGNAVINVLI